MKKILILGFMLITLLLTGCNTEKEPDPVFTLISKDFSAINYVEDTFIVIEDLDSFKTYFSNDQNKKDLEKINEDTFSKHVLIYFEYVSHKDFKKEEYILNSVYKENETLFFEIITPALTTDIWVTKTISYLVQVDKNTMENIKDYQIKNNVYIEEQ